MNAVSIGMTDIEIIRLFMEHAYSHEEL
jgi:hypothetical protein